MSKWIDFILSFVFGRLNAQTLLRLQTKESALPLYEHQRDSPPLLALSSMIESSLPSNNPRAIMIL